MEPSTRLPKKEFDLPERITTSSATFLSLFHGAPTVITRAPGRAEILGCHTDYNSGFALAAGISKSTIALLSRRTDSQFSVYSNSYPGREPILFSIDELIRDEVITWPNYVKAVVRELMQNTYAIGGANILIDSTVPKSGGVSSSAALELAIAYGLLALYKQPIDTTKVALLCKTAENSDLVKSPCGFLDQGASAFASDDGMVFMDFLADGASPVSKIEVIPSVFPIPATFVIPVDPTLERQLGETGYVARRALCEASLPYWTQKLGRTIGSLRNVSVIEFETHRNDLDVYNSEMRKRCEHVIYENARVLAAVIALKSQNIETFGKLLTEGGRSSLELYGLDENTPQLTFLVEKGRVLDGVIGMRNMGGGFSAIALALVKNEQMADFQKTLSGLYKKQFNRTLSFIEFTPSQGAQVLVS